MKLSNLKKVLFLILSLAFVFSLTSCNEEDKSQFEALSFDDASSEWKPSLLYKAGLENMVEPDGTKTFSEDENGNVTFTVTPADEHLLTTVATGVFSKISNFTSEITPSSFDDAFESETKFKLSYKNGDTPVIFELSLENGILKGTISYN